MRCYAFVPFVLISAIYLAAATDKIDLTKDAEDFIKELEMEDASKEKAHDHSMHGHDHAMAGHDHATGGHGEHVMKMYFHGGYNEIILFEFWRIDSLFGLVLSSLAIFVMATTYEGIKWFRIYLQSQVFRRTIAKDIEIPLNENANRAAAEPLYTNADGEPSSDPRSVFFPPRMVQAGLYLIQLVLAYWLMLIVMTYNSWLTAAVIVGAGFGHWIFAVLQLRSADGDAAETFVTDACH